MTVGIVGVGLIGGSIGLALRDPSRRIVGFDANEEHRMLALSRSCVDAIVSLDEVAQADLVFVCTPPASVPGVLERLLETKRPETVVTDCASVKLGIITWLSQHAPKEGMFVGGHPMAGHEKGGPGFSSGWMFRGARWILTPTKSTKSAAIRLVEATVKEMGAIPIRVDAESHDRHVAVLSHVPHVLAAVLVQMGAELSDTSASAGSWKDLTRVGGADPALWTDILVSNRSQVSLALAHLEDELAQVRESLDRTDVAAIAAFFERARDAKGAHEA